MASVSCNEARQKAQLTLQEIHGSEEERAKLLCAHLVKLNARYSPSGTAPVGRHSFPSCFRIPKDALRRAQSVANKGGIALRRLRRFVTATSPDSPEEADAVRLRSPARSSQPLFLILSVL